MHPLVDPVMLLRALTSPAPSTAPPDPRAFARADAVADPAADAGPGPGGYVISALQQAGTLVGVPLSYVVPDPALLRHPAVPDPDDPGSIQFFVIDPRWVRALRMGMLAAGSPDPTDTADAVAVLERFVPEPPTPLSGLLLSSTLVADYPGLAVRAWTGAVGVEQDPDDPALGAVPVPLLRCDRITPSVLVVVFATVPDIVVIEEPHGMVRLGVRRGPAAGPAVAVRATDGTLVEVAGAAIEVAVPMRGNPTDGVIDVAGLAAALGQAVAATPASSRAPDPTTSAGALALQLLVPAARQRYQRGVS